jgi:hypothetical protein
MLLFSYRAVLKKENILFCLNLSQMAYLVLIYHMASGPIGPRNRKTFEQWKIILMMS